MFGNNNNQQSEDNQPASDTPQVVVPQPDPSADTSAITTESPSYLPNVPAAATPPAEGAPEYSDFSAPAEPAAAPAPEPSSAPEPSPSEPARSTAPTDSSDDLLQLKQEALQQLSPLVVQLEQSPEERFKTYMMMIQASDDRTLVRKAYESAQEIEDEKVRAQALLDIVNEINYFTQKNEA